MTLNFPSAPTNGQVYEQYTWDATAGIWKNTVVPTSLDDIADVTAPTPATGDVLTWGGSAWVNEKSVSGENILYNGAMQVHQRGASRTGTTTTGYYTADRWQTNLSSAGTWTQTVENDAPTGSGFRKSFKITCTTAKSTLSSTDALYIVQALEGQDVQRLKKGTSAAESITLSFWVKSNVTGTYVAVLYDNDNNRAVGGTYSISTSATWQKVSMTMPPDTTGAFDNDNAASLLVYHYLAAGSSFTSGALPTVWESALSVNIGAGQVNLASATSNYWQITGVQLEAGASESPFNFKSLSQELAECQRYYYRIPAEGGIRTVSTGYATSATTLDVYIPFPTTLRTTPAALEQSGTATDYGVRYQNTDANCSAVPTFLSAGTTAANVRFTVASLLTTGQGGFGRNNANGFLAWSAEL
jgi:hypothetical protein